MDLQRLLGVSGGQVLFLDLAGGGQGVCSLGDDSLSNTFVLCSFLKLCCSSQSRDHWTLVSTWEEGNVETPKCNQRTHWEKKN